MFVILRSIIFAIALVMLNNCSGDKCIDADDFGFPKITIPARYPANDITGIKDMQVAKWIDSGYLVNGENLVILVKNWNKKFKHAPVSAWCPWYGKETDGNDLSKLCKNLDPCEFESDEDTEFYNITNAPCLMTKGVGLYALINQRKEPDPNILIETQKIPHGATMHVGFKQDPPLKALSDDGSYKDAGGIIWGDYSQNLTGGRLYFKILDNYYENNSGQYRIVIKSGIVEEKGDPLQYIVKLIKNKLFSDKLEYRKKENTKTSDDTSIKGSKGFVEKIYKNIVEQSGFRKFVIALLTLYIVSFGFLYLIGLVGMSHTEMLSRVLKIIIVSVLLTENSWSFFYDNFFILFIEGPSTIISWLGKASNSGPGNDSIIALMMAPETLYKLSSLLFASWDGLIFIFVYFLLFGFLLFVLIKASITYLVALIMISMIILTAPIFMCFMLFKFTRNFFDNWLKQLISYSIQPIILFAGIAFMSLIIRHEIYATLGFKICKLGFWNNSQDPEKPNYLISWYFPDPMKGENFNKEKQKIYVPEDHYKTDSKPDSSSESNSICEANPEYKGLGIVSNRLKERQFFKAYESIEERFIELPFLDPNLPGDCDAIKNFFNGNFIHWYTLFILSIAIFLLYYFNNIAISISNFIASTMNNMFSVGMVSDQAYQSGKTVVKKRAKNVDTMLGSPVAKSINQIRNLVKRKNTVSHHANQPTSNSKNSQNSDNNSSN